MCSPSRRVRSATWTASVATSQRRFRASACNATCASPATAAARPKDRFVSTPDGEPGLNYLCEGYQAFFRHVDEPMRAMCALLDQGRAPAEHSRRYAAADLPA
jgi:sulfatase maturation enzyme AslB (radical SAM superfamily)